MGIGMQVVVDDAQLRRGFAALSKVGGNLRPVLGEIGLFMQRSARRRLRARPRRRLGIRTHKLEQSIAMRLEAFAVTVGSNLVYAPIQQVGGTIVPKTARALAIPMQASLARRGVWPRDLPAGSLRFVPARRGNTVGYLFDATEPGETGRLMFVLVRQTEIKGQPYLVFGAEEQAFARRAVSNAIRAALARSRGGS